MVNGLIKINSDLYVDFSFIDKVNTSRVGISKENLLYALNIQVSEDQYRSRSLSPSKLQEYRSPNDVTVDTYARPNTEEMQIIIENTSSRVNSEKNTDLVDNRKMPESIFDVATTGTNPRKEEQRYKDDQEKDTEFTIVEESGEMSSSIFKKQGINIQE